MYKLLNYLRHSNINISINLNPVLWRLRAFYDAPTELDPRCHFFCLQILPIRISLIIDNGDY